MNEHVTYGLNLYIKDTDPQSAVLLKGDWGCGKTHFIKEWMQKQKQDQNSACEVVYVSLFGISSLKGLKDAVNKAISPIMYKVEKYKKDVLKAAKVVLKYDSTIADIKDAIIQYELNPLDLLAQLNLSENSKEYKLFVLDDVERCDIPLKELFGFVDYLFEHVGCRVVLIVGKTDLQDAKWKETLHKYQEKNSRTRICNRTGCGCGNKRLCRRDSNYIPIVVCFLESTQRCYCCRMESIEV